MRIYKEGGAAWLVKSPVSLEEWMPTSQQHPGPTIAKMKRFPCAAARRHFGVVVVLTVASILIVIAAPSQAQENETTEQKQHYCGKALAGALQVACHGRYYSPYGKKSLGVPQAQDELRRQQENDPEFYWQRQSQDNLYDLDQLQGFQADLGNAAWNPRPRPAQSPFPFRELFNGRAFMSQPQRRRIRGIIDECCSRPCTMTQLQAYCADTVQN